MFCSVQVRNWRVDPGAGVKSSPAQSICGGYIENKLELVHWVARPARDLLRPPPPMLHVTMCMYMYIDTRRVHQPQLSRGGGWFSGS